MPTLTSKNIINAELETREKTQVAEGMNRIGQFMRFYSGGVDGMTRLTLYRESDWIQKELPGFEERTGSQSFENTSSFLRT